VVQATDFGKGQTNVWAKTLVWQRDIFECGRMCEKDRSARAHELAVRIAEMELDAQRYRETVAAKEASCLQM